MITYQEAIRIIDEHTPVLGSEIVPIRSRITAAADIFAQCDSPPFDNSAVDGYGRRHEDLSTSKLPLIGAIAAGDAPSHVPPGHCVRILTGAPVPPEIDAVVMQEDCEVEDGFVRFDSDSKSGDHIRRAGSDFVTGDKLVEAGTRLNPGTVGLLASAGINTFEAVSKTRVTIITTGNELVDVGKPLGPGQIFNSNQVALYEALRGHCARVHQWHCPDDPEAILTRLAFLTPTEDVVITCGGVSVGDHDYLKDVFAAHGIVKRFWGVAIKPGKPIFFGTKGRTLIFGLPGNPVSALVTFYLFVRPALLKMSGHPDPWPRPIEARFEGKARKKPERMEFLRGVMSPDGAVALSGQNSHQLAALAAANCLIHFPREASELNSGDKVEVTPLNWSSTGL